MRKNDIKLFLDKGKLYELTNLRRSGWGLTSLAIYFGCDTSSIRYQCDKYDIEPLLGVFTFEQILKPILQDFQQINRGLNPGKSYREYLVSAGYDPQEYLKNYYVERN